MSGILDVDSRAVPQSRFVTALTSVSMLLIASVVPIWTHLGSKTHFFVTEVQSSTSRAFVDNVGVQIFSKHGAYYERTCSSRQFGITDVCDFLCLFAGSSHKYIVNYFNCHIVRVTVFPLSSESHSTYDECSFSFSV